MVPEELLNDPEFRSEALKRLKQENELGELALKVKRREAKIVAASGDTRGYFSYVGPIVEEGVHTFITSAENWSRRNEGRDIEILLDSPGGSVLDGLAFIDFLMVLRKRGHHVKIIGTGVVASMAGVILQAADERCLTSRAYFGMHEVSSYIGGTISQQDDQMKFSKKLQARCEEMLTARSNLTARKLKGMWKRKDIWCDAKEALALGLIDRIEDTEIFVKDSVTDVGA